MSSLANPGPAGAPHTSGAADVGAFVASAVLTAVAYLLWLGWHEPKHLMPGTSQYVGPHEAWQVIGLVLTLGAIAAIGGWRRLVVATVMGTAGAVTFMFAYEAATEHQDDASIWPVGAVMLLVASLVGLFAVALVARGAHRLYLIVRYR